MELWTHAPADQVNINIETKIEEAHPDYTVDYKKFVELVMNDLELAEFPLQRVILQSFDFRTITFAKMHWKTTEIFLESDDFRSAKRCARGRPAGRE